MSIQRQIKFILDNAEGNTGHFNRIGCCREIASPGFERCKSDQIGANMIIIACPSVFRVGMQATNS